MGITKPTDESHIANANSIFASMPLVKLVQRQEFELDPVEMQEKIRELRRTVDRGNDTRNAERLDSILGSDFITAEMKIALKACKEKGASSWLTAYPRSRQYSTQRPLY